MSIWNLFSLVGGLSLFLYGMMEMNKNLTKIAGSRMKSIMLTLTKGPARGYLTGLGITIINQSSSATTVLEAALVGAGFMTFQQSLSVTLGAELGSTFLPQLVAFPSITKISSLVVFIGFMLLFTVKKKKHRYVAMTVFSFGLLFLGMNIMSAALIPLRTFEPFINLMKSVETPILGILLGLFFTMIIQSSGATAGITIAMAVAGTISLEQAIPINLGAAVGTCITAVLGSIALDWEAKRSAYIHVLFQMIGVVWIFILLIIPFKEERFYVWFIKWVTSTFFHTENLSRQIAMSFTFMPIINHIIIFPNLKLVVKLFNKIFPEREQPKPYGAKYLDKGLIAKSIELSLVMAKKEILRGSKLLNEMLIEMKGAFRTKDTEIIEKLKILDTKVDTLHKQIIPFLAALSQEEISAKESNLCMNYIYIQNEIETIGDIIEKNIMSLVKKKIEQNMIFSEEGFHELEHLIFKILRNFENFLLAFEKENITYSNYIIDSYKRKEVEKYKGLHIDRLYKGNTESIATSSVHLDLIEYFSRINDHIAYIAKRLNKILENETTSV